MKSAKFWIEKLGLQKHPEGGWFKEVYRSEDVVTSNALPKGFSGERNFSTSIYYLLEGDDFSAFHRIKSDELWHYYTGTSCIEIVWIDGEQIRKSKVGSNIESNEYFQVVIPKNHWFAAHLLSKNGFALVGCTVSPGFNFNDFEMADKSLIEDFPELKDVFKKLIKS